jgi:hypothetical protein
MPVAVVQEWAEGGNDTTSYDALHAKITAAETMPDGFLVHAAGATEHGGFRIFEVWESEAHFERFVQERLMPALAELGGGGDPPTVRTYELHGFVTR